MATWASFATCALFAILIANVAPRLFGEITLRQLWCYVTNRGLKNGISLFQSEHSFVIKTEFRNHRNRR
jgi:hypothetical protein